MKKLLALALLIVALLLNVAVKAEEAKPDDAVTFNLSAESWVTTKTARAVVSVEAAVTSQTSGAMRADMMKAVSALAKGEWRMTAFNRSQDQTGMERWSATYETRVSEGDLSGLAEKAKQASKAGLQLTVAEVDFSPTLEERQAAEAALRAQIYKMANEQLATLNATITGRAYRIAGINFNGMDLRGGGRNAMMLRSAKMADMQAYGAAAPEMAAAPMEQSDKLTLTARVTLAAAPVPQVKP